ncbi:S1 family peptidase [Haliscomenobacter hydrossis]|nr:serine protease [Haliscomenobacter hydrossis]
MTYPNVAVFALCLLPLTGLSQSKEKWIDAPKSAWPQIALINTVQFKNGDRYIDPSFTYAGTGFLIDNGRDTLAATAKHALWIAKNKKSKAVEINAELKEWVMRPKGNTRDSAIMDRLLNEDPNEVLEGRGSSVTERDWIVFSVKITSAQLYPLKPRYTPLTPGEKVYILSNAYNDATTMVYEGTVLRKLGMDILIERNMQDHKGGSSGSPVIDANGFLIGIISSSSSDSKTGKGVSVAISTEYLANVLSKKAGLNDPKKDYGELLLKTAQERNAKAVIKQYLQLVQDPQNYYSYNLRSSDRNGLRETGIKLMEMKRFQDAVEILQFNARENSNFYLNYNLLAEAQLLHGDKKGAIKSYQVSTEKYPDAVNNPAFKALEKLLSKN